MSVQGVRSADPPARCKSSVERRDDGRQHVFGRQTGLEAYELRPMNVARKTILLCDVMETNVQFGNISSNFSAILNHVDTTLTCNEVNKVSVIPTLYPIRLFLQLWATGTPLRSM